MVRRTSREIKLPAWRQENEQEAKEEPTPSSSRKSTQKKRARSSSSASTKSRKTGSNSKSAHTHTPSSRQKRGDDPKSMKKSNRTKSHVATTSSKSNTSTSSSPKTPPQTSTTPPRPTKNWTPEQDTYGSQSLHLSPSRSLAAYAMMEIASTGKERQSFSQLASPHDLNATFGQAADENADPAVPHSTTTTASSSTQTTSFDARLEASTANMGKSSKKSHKRSRKGHKLHTATATEERYGEETVFQHNHGHEYNPQNQAFLVEGFPDRSDPSDKSLGSLCERFMIMFRTTKPRGISLDDAAAKLGIERRRIYDVINILEAFDIVSRKEKNTYWWHGTCHLHLTLLELKEEAMAERTYLLPDRQDHVTIHPFEHSSIDQIPETFHVAASDPFSSEDEHYCLELCQYDDEHPRIPNTTSSSKTSKLSERKENSMGSLARKFIQIFLLGRQVLSLEDAAALLSSPDNGSNAKLKTTVRRLYDIANVMCILRIIDKIPVPNSRKPAFQWRGMAEVPMLDGVSRRAAAAAVEGEARLSRKKKKKGKDPRDTCNAYHDQYDDILRRIEISENQSRTDGRRLSVPEPQAPAREVTTLSFFPSHAEVFGYSDSSDNHPQATVVRASIRSGKENDVDQGSEPAAANTNMPEMEYENADVTALMDDGGPFATSFLDDDYPYDDVFTPPFGDRDSSFAFSTDKGGRQKSPPATIKSQFTSMRFQAGAAFCSPQVRGLFSEKQLNVSNGDAKRQKVHEEDAETSAQKVEINASAVSAAYATVGASIPQVTSPTQDVAASKAVDTPVAGADATPYQFRFGNTPCTGVDTPSVSSTKKREAQAADEKISALRPVSLVTSERPAPGAHLSKATDEPTAQSQTAGWTTNTVSENPTARGNQNSSRPTSKGDTECTVGEADKKQSMSLNHQTSSQTSTKGSPCPAADLFSKFSEVAARKAVPSNCNNADDKNMQRDCNSSAASEKYDTQGFVIARRSAGSRSSNFSGRSTSSDSE
eukprot:gb/GECG01012122.1/.p1 GENE.gb/GECG01012122.1/~~gb/GECG01012122.1/.p1  ORF type:complete len:998 (+),score=159.10 gb/GECG01012122.1/:1-2994(+)